MDKKLFAFDIDGTLLNSQLKPLESTRLAIEQLRAQGHYVTIATGRSRVLAKPVIETLGFENYILCNGAAAFKAHQQIYKQLLPMDSLHELKEEATDMGIDIALVGLDETKRLTSTDLPKMADAMESFGSELPELDLDFAKQDIYSALAYYNHQYEGRFDDKYPELRFVRWHPNCVDVLTQGSSKAATILEVAEQLKINQENIICFGDGINDREMLSMAGVGVAMGNASEQVKKHADLVTDDNDSDGIFKALQKLGLIAS